MFRYIFKLALTLIPIFGTSQVIDGKTYTPFNNYYKWRGGAFDTTLLIPQTASQNGKRPGAIYYNSSDSSIYSWTGSQWRKANSDIPTLQQVTTAGKITTDSVNIVDASNNRLLSLARTQIGGPTDLSGRLILRSNFNSNYAFYNPAGITYITSTNTTNIAFPDTGIASRFATRVAINGNTYAPSTGGLINLGNVLTDTTSISARIDQRVRYSDTSIMLNPYKFTAANGLTKDSTVFRLGGSLNQNTNINLSTRRLSIIGGADTTRLFSNGRMSIGGSPDSSFMLNVNGDTRIKGVLNFEPSQNTNQIRITSGSYSVGGNSTSQRLIAIGPFAAQALTSSGGESLVAIGQNTGGQTTSGGRYSVLIGRNAGNGITTGELNTIISSGDAQNLPSNTSNAIHLVAGGGYEFNNADTALLGLTGRYAFIGGGFNQFSYINDFYLGAGHRVKQPNLAHLNLYAPSGYPTAIDTIGSDFTINAGRGTGAGIGGSIIFKTSSTTTSGTTLQTLTERARISPTGSLLVNRQSQIIADTIYKLDVNGNVRLNGWVDDTNVPGNSGNWGKNIGTNIYFANTVSGVGFKVGPGTDGNYRFILASNGNIQGLVNNFGIGLESPTAKLHVANTTDSACFIVSDTNTTTGIDQTPFVIHNNGDVSVGTRIDDTSSIVNIVSTAKGFLQPRMTNTQRDAITTPATGLQLFSTTDSANYVYRGTGGGWQKIANEISGSATLDFPTTSNNTHSDLTVTVTGATAGDVVSIGVPNVAVNDHSCYTAWVSADNQVTVRFNNYGGGSHDPASGTFKIKVFK